MMPNNDLDGLAICPYLKKYIDSIDITLHSSVESLYDSIADIVAKKLPAHVCVIEWDWDYFEMETATEQLHLLYRKDDMEFLFMHPDSEDAPLPIADYNFDKPLLIVQQRSLLHKARKQLAHKTNYYKHFNNKT